MRISLWLVDSTRAARIHGSLTAADDRCAITRCYHRGYDVVCDFTNKIKSYEIARRATLYSRANDGNVSLAL